MKKTFALISLVIFFATALPIKASEGPTSILLTPPAPVFTTVERHAELAATRRGRGKDGRQERNDSI